VTSGIRGRVISTFCHSVKVATGCDPAPDRLLLGSLSLFPRSKAGSGCWGLARLVRLGHARGSEIEGDGVVVAHYCFHRFGGCVIWGLS
jgi:hypothetical protein